MGLVELGAGLLLVAGVVAAASQSLLDDLGTGHDTGWFLAIGGAIALASAMLPRFVRSNRSVSHRPGSGMM